MNVAAVINVEGEGRRLVFRCPGCKCSHGVPVDGSRGWSWNGDLEKPTLSPSILITYGRDPRPDRPQTCHSFVREGRIEYCGDCEHELAGKIVPLEPI